MNSVGLNSAQPAYNRGESMRARVIGGINREKWRIDTNRRNHMKAAA